MHVSGQWSVSRNRMFQLASGLAWYISPIYIIDIHRILSFENIIYFRYIWFVWTFFYSVNVTHCDYVLMSTVCVFYWLITCALRIFSVLDNFCQIAPLHSNAVWMTRVLHLICKHTHTHTAMCVCTLVNVTGLNINFNRSFYSLPQISTIASSNYRQK